MSPQHDLHFDGDEGLESLVAGFERGDAPSGGFTHQAHIAVALVYLHRYGLDGAIERLRETLLAFLERSLGDATAARVKYRETVTGFWLRLLDAELAHSEQGPALFARVNPLLDRYRDASIIRLYYSAERLDSDEARATYLEPDLKPLPPRPARAETSRS